MTLMTGARLGVYEISALLGAAAAVAETSAQRRPRFSPVVRFIAYDPDETGDSEVYAQPCPPAGRQWQVSVGWRRRTNVARRRPRDVLHRWDRHAGGAAGDGFGYGFLPGAATRMFSIGQRNGGGSSRYDAALDGRRVLVRTIVDPPMQPLMILLNWMARSKT